MTHKTLLDSERDTYIKLNTLQVYPLLLEIARHQEMVANGSSHKRFVLYSAHDKTLHALKIALGVRDVTHQPYASRLVFELYRKWDDKSLYLRVLFNGMDLTSQLSFCTKSDNLHGMCAFESFKNFIFDTEARVGDKSYRDACYS